MPAAAQAAEPNAIEAHDFDVLQCIDELAWHEQRRLGITGSEAPALWAAEIAEVTDGEQSFSWESPYSLWCAKRALATRDFEGDGERLYWGHVLEPIIAYEYAKRFKRRLVDPGRTTLLVNRDRPYLRATLDRVIVDNGQGRGHGVLECKNTSGFLARHWSDGRPPERVWAQIQHQLAVTGWGWGVAAALIGGNQYIAELVLRDDEWITDHLARVDELWDCVVAGRAPKTDASDATTRAIAARWRVHSKELRPITPEAAERWQALIDARAAKGKAEEAATEQTNWLREYIGDAGGIQGLVSLRIEDGRVKHSAIAERYLAQLAPKEAAALIEANRGEPIKKLTKWKPPKAAKRRQKG